MNSYDAPWKPVTEGLPDSDTTVLIHNPTDSEPVGVGYHDGEHWCDAGGTRLPDGAVTHWVDYPNPPK